MSYREVAADSNDDVFDPNADDPTDQTPDSGEIESANDAGSQLAPEAAASQREPEAPAPAIRRLVYRRKFNLGNYQNEDIEAEAYIADGEDPAAVFAAIKRFVHACGPKLDRWGYVLPDDAQEDRP